MRLREKRLWPLVVLAVWALLTVATHAQQRPMLLIQDADCVTEACTEGFQWCEQSGSATLYHCDTTTGFYVEFGSGGGTPGGSDTHVQFNDGGSFGGDAGLLYFKAIDTLAPGALIVSSGNATVTTGNIVATAGNVQLSASGATVDGKNLDLVPANAAIVHICPSGCEYATLNAAWAGETSTSASPIVYRLHAGVYTTQQKCDGADDSASIIGDGVEATRIVVAGLTTNEGALDLHTCTNMSVSNMHISGNIAIHNEGSGDFHYSNLSLLSPAAAGTVGHCIRDSDASAATRIFRDNITCQTGEEGFSIGVNGANYEVYESGMTILNDPTNNVSEGSYCWNFGSNPSLFYSRSAVCNRTHDDDENTDFGCINSKQNQDGGADGALMIWDSLTCKLRSTAAVAANVDMTAVEVEEITYTLDSTLRFYNLGVSLTLDNGVAGGGNDNDGYGIVLENVAATNAFIEVYGGSISGDNGISGLDIQDKGAGSQERIKVTDFGFRTGIADDYGLLDSGSIYATRGVLVDVETISSGNAPYLIVSSTTAAREGIRLTSAGTTSPIANICSNGTTNCMTLRVDTSGNLEFRDQGGTLRAEIDTDGDLHVTDDLQIDKAGGTAFIGNGTASDANRIYFNAATTDLSITWNDTSNRVDIAGADIYRQGAVLATAPTSCTIGDLYNDSSGGRCYCSATNTWEQLNAVGDCT